MQLGLVTATLKSLTGMPEDSVVMSFATQLGGDPSPSTALASWKDALISFFNDAQTGAVALAYYLATHLNRSAGQVDLRLYDIEGHLDGSPHGSPVATDVMTLGAGSPSGWDFPSEVSSVLTLRATGALEAAVEAPDGSDPGSAIDRPRQRRSGRLFIGPLQRESGATSTGVPQRPNSAFITVCLDAAEDLQASVNADGHNWSVWSRVDEALRNVDSVSMDNAFDTQRRRGEDATSRTSRAV